ncbi:MAG: TIGR03618 family F420-dependent PPOX class oxidoreductase [Anaerolineales bacterium]|nr:TIGR03618 family F420-dependent PPOX class oxidoreductase [Anaerolineales bacterium]MDW8447669.1 TIGR03618 family F420-dependent PPOX class oxidoreductase [Anaerolineales bacterium]
MCATPTESQPCLPIKGPFTPEKLRNFLARPLIARFATVTPQGKPHVVPVWYDWDGRYLWVTIDRRSQKYRNMVANPYCAVTIDETWGGLRFIGAIFEGSVELIDQPEDWAREFVRKVYTRYMGEEGLCAPTIQRMINEGQHVVVKISPEKILTWDDTSGPAPVG